MENILEVQEKMIQLFINNQKNILDLFLQFQAQGNEAIKLYLQESEKTVKRWTG